MKRLGLSLLVLPLALLCACGSASLPAEQTSAPTAEPPASIEVLTVAETPVPTALPAPEAPEATDGDDAGSCTQKFSIVWISDTQHYSELYPDMLRGMTKWAADNRESLNIQLVVHTGDMVNRVGSDRQWEAITEALDELGDLPFLALAGNHDVGTSTGNYHPFLHYVASRYPDTEAFFAGGRGAYVTLGTEDCGFLFIGTGYGYSDESVQWMYDTIQAHPLYTAVLCEHSYLNTNGSLTDGGDILFEQIVRRCPTVRLVICGHRDDIAFLDQSFDNNGDGIADRHVYAMLYNYQEVASDGGGGYLRILTFDIAARSVSVKTYSPSLDQYKTGADEGFVIENAF